MTCDEREPLIGAYVDGELDASGALEMESHIATCGTCSRFLSDIRSVHAALRQPALIAGTPRDLEDKVRRAIRNTGQAPQVSTHPGEGFQLAPWRWRGGVALVAAAVMLFAVVGIQLMSGRSGVNHDSLLADQVVSSHIRSMMPGHLFDVASTDQHTVKPWFDGKVDYAPPVTDFRTQGFPLIGGRLDYIDNRPVSALIYGRYKHIINLFVWPIEKPEPAVSAMQNASRQGYHVEYWNNAGMTFWAVSDVNTADLSLFCRMVDQAAAPVKS